MTKEEAKELLPIIQAIVAGKTVQFRINSESEWCDINANESVCFNYDKNNYRIKPEPKYRPFKNKDECWNEMLKHHPFGWVKYKNNGAYLHISSVMKNVYIGDLECYSYKDLLSLYTFADDTPFGILE